MSLSSMTMLKSSQTPAHIVGFGVLLVATLLVTGCGGHNDNNGATTSSTTTPPSTDDAFVTVVRQQTDTPNALSQTSTPIDISGIQATAPQNTQPQPVTF